MVLLLFFIALTITTSCQEDITEKSLNEMLDQLIEETVLTYSNENENNSRIIYIKPDNETRRSYDPRPNRANSIEFDDIENLIHEIEKPNHPNQDSSEIVVKIERTEGHYLINSGGQDMNIMNNEITKSGRLHKGGVNSIVVLGSDPGSNLIHNYPEIVIDKITYNTDENGNIVKGELPAKAALPVQHVNEKYFTAEEKEEVAVKALDSLVKMIMNRAPTERKSLEISMEQEQDGLNNIARSTHIHNDYHNHVINNLPLPYGGLTPRRKISLGKLPEGYRDLHHIISRPMNAYLDSNLQLTRWGGNGGQNPLMSISRAHNRNRVRFIPKPLNIMPRILYQPVFHRNYPG